MHSVYQKGNPGAGQVWNLSITAVFSPEDLNFGHDSNGNKEERAVTKTWLLTEKW